MGSLLVKRFCAFTVHSSELIHGIANGCRDTTEEFVTVFRLTDVFVTTVTSIRCVVLAARCSMIQWMCSKCITGKQCLPLRMRAPVAPEQADGLYSYLVSVTGAPNFKIWNTS
jgi:hypothetical protein